METRQAKIYLCDLVFAGAGILFVVFFSSLRRVLCDGSAQVINSNSNATTVVLNSLMVVRHIVCPGR